LIAQVPSYFTNAQRRAVLQATTIAGLNVKRLLNDSTAAALAYFQSRKTLLEADEATRSENVVFLDVGYSCAQVFCASISKEGVKVILDPRGLDVDLWRSVELWKTLFVSALRIQMLCCVADPYVGGRNFDVALAVHFHAEFMREKRCRFKHKDRSWLRLLQEVEKLKHDLSGDDDSDQTIFVPKVVGDIDLASKMNR
jgi:molecular chaperone DnaK (HSP70)